VAITESSTESDLCGNTKVITRTWTATDDCGNQTSGVQTITVVDTTPPSINVPADVTIECTADESSANTGLATGSDTCGGVAITESSTESDLCGNTKVITRTWTATDDCGNQTSGVQTITVVDTTPPSITCPGNITQDNDLGLCSAVITYSVTHSDTCGSTTIVQTAGLASGSAFPVGTTTNTFIVTDACGNESTCSFDVTINDNELPVVVCNDITVQLDNTGNATITAAQIDGGSTDNCGIASIVLDDYSFDCSDISTGGSSGDQVWINEFHYDNTGTDAGEFVEVAGTAGLNLTGYSILLYNGSGGAVYNTIALSGIIDNEGVSGFGALNFSLPTDGLQNGAPDGIALVNGSTVLEFISYEGTFTAVGGAANGVLSTDVGVSETS
jgi:hypothetical protein